MQMPHDRKLAVCAVIPAFNAGKYVGRAIDSVLAQTCPPAEVIVVDDGSTDDTGLVVSKYGDRVRYIRQRNGGASVARNTGIEAARGDWIAFLDADDVWLPEKLQRQTDHLRQNPGLVWTYSNYFIQSYGKASRTLAFAPLQYAKALKEWGYFDDYLGVYPAVCIRTSTVLIKKAIFQQTGLFRVGQLWAQDTDMFLRIAYTHPLIGFIAEPLAVYHADIPGSITLANKQRIIQRCDFLDRHLQLAAEQGRLAAFEPCARQLAVSWIKSILSEDRFADVSEILNRFGPLLPPRLCDEVRLRMKYPRVAPAAIACYFYIKDKLRSLRVWPKG